MAITNKKKYSKIPEIASFVSSIIVGIHVFLIALQNDCATMTASLGYSTIEYYNGCIASTFLIPILFAFPIGILGLFLRHRRIKKEKILS